MTTLNETHDPALRSWVAIANHRGRRDFPIQNLPLAVFRRRGSQRSLPRRRGDRRPDRRPRRGGRPRRLRPVTPPAVRALPAGDALNAFMALGPAAWSALRLALSRALREGAARAGALEPCLVAQADAEYALPARIGDYTDFYTGIHHATTVGKLFRPDNPLLPNYKWVPIGYHGRASSHRGQRHADPPPARPDQGQPPTRRSSGPVSGSTTSSNSAS